ncbi:MAG TPA: hypothetical protein VFQ65_14470 [Kofleriaceae bacterium]|nr:hypothetical protein [Kofleriaceae bacterium]
MLRWLTIALGACSLAQPIDMPDGAPGIGFDDLQYSARLHRVLVPGGRSGKLDLVDPDTHDVTSIDGFSTTSQFDSNGHDIGVTAVADLGSLLAVTDRTSGKLSLVDLDTSSVVADATIGSTPDYVRWVAATSELWISEPDRETLEVFAVVLSPPSVTQNGTIHVAGGPESLVIDPVHGRAFTNLWAGATVGVDVATRIVGPAWSNHCSDSRGIAVDATRGFVFAGCAEGRVVAIDQTDGRVVGEQWPLDGIDVIDFSPSRRHLYAAGQISANLGIFGVSTTGELGLLGIADGTLYGHCVTTDDAGHAFVCDPRGGRLLVDDDRFDPITR